ncbi:MAG: cytochrome c oxidase subunit II, partial [Acidobacteriota bacterium]|nr:cytochrome c oxidase subunit II [Acidobacteriota bacterium]
MLSDFPLWPEQASTVAPGVDALMTFMCIVTGSVSALVFITIFVLAIKYRRTPENELAQDYEPPKALEAAWIIIPFIIFMGMFVWGSWLYFRIQRVPENSLDIYA